MMPGTERSAAGVGDRAKTRDAVGDNDTRHPAELALRAHRLCRQSRFTSDQQRGKSVEQLPAVDRAALQLIVNLDVRRGRSGGRQCGRCTRDWHRPPK